MVKTLIVFLLTVVVPLLLSAQCLLAPPAPDCNGTEPLAASGQTIGASITRWFYGGPQTFTGLTLDGGTLVVCGNLTLNDLTFNAGVIYIRPGAVLTVTGGPAMLMQGGCYIYNYGKIAIQRGLVLNNAHTSAAQPNVFINAGTASVLEVLFDYVVINNPYSWFVNEGKASLGGFVSDPQSAAGSVCLGSGSQTSMNILINNAAKTYAAPSGAACVAVSQHAYICEQVTDDAAVHVCMAPTGGTDSSCLVSRGKTKAWGNGVVFNGCTNCAAMAILPLHTPNPGDDRMVMPGREAVRSGPEIYPNPFTSVLSIRLPAGERVVDVVMTDVLGRTIVHIHPAGDQDRILLPDERAVTAGCYMLRVVTSKKVYLRRVVKR